MFIGCVYMFTFIQILIFDLTIKITRHKVVYGLVTVSLWWEMIDFRWNTFWNRPTTFFVHWWWRFNTPNLLFFIRLHSIFNWKWFYSRLAKLIVFSSKPLDGLVFHSMWFKCIQNIHGIRWISLNKSLTTIIIMFT